LGEPRLAEDLLDRKRTPRHVRGMLEHRGVTHHEARRRESEDLPEWEVPRHYRQHDAERVERDKALVGFSPDRLGCQKSLGVLGRWCLFSLGRDILAG